MKTWISLSITLLTCEFAAALDGPTASRNDFTLSTNWVRLTPEFVGQLGDELRTNNPSVHAAQWRANAADSNSRTVSTWADPMAKIGGMGARTENRMDDGDLIYGAEQKLPLFGMPQSERRVMKAEAEIATAKIDVAFQTRRRDLAKALFRSALADRAVALGEEDISWLDTLVSSVEGRYRNGTATLSELIQVQNERARRQNQLLTDASSVHHEHVGINRLLNRSSGFHWDRFALPDVATPVPFTPRLLELALKNEPKLRVMQRDLEMAEAAVDVSRRARLPEVSVEAQGRNYSRNGDFRSAEVMLNFSLPWGNRGKYDAMLKRDKAKVTAVEYDIDAERKALTEEIHQLTFMIDNARREAVLYRDELIPRSRTALDAANSAWLSGKGMLRDVIEARRMLTEAELMYARAISEQYQAMSELVLCCGIGDFEALQMIHVKEEKVTP